MEDSKVEGKFTRTANEGRGKINLVVNIEVSKDGSLRERTELQNVLYFRSLIVKKKNTVVRGDRGEVNSTNKFSKRKMEIRKIQEHGQESMLSCCKYRRNIQL